MSWIFVIEESQELYAQIEEAVSQIEPKISIVRLRDSQAFLTWMTGLVQNDPKLDPPAPKEKFLGLITAVETWKFRDVKLIGKFKSLFIQKGLATSEDDLGVVFTAYETSALERKRFEQRAVNNVIHKPFDKVILRQMIEIAFTGRHPVQNYYVHNQQTETKVEMLKEIVMTGLTEVGLRTISDQKIEVGKLSKYYAKFLETDQHRSAIAQVLRYEPIAPVAAPPSETGRSAAPENANVFLRFFALDQQQSFHLQKLVREQSRKHALSGHPAKSTEFEFIFVTHPKSALCHEVLPSFERFYDHPMRVVESFTELTQVLHQSVSGLVRRYFIFVDRMHVIGNEVAELRGNINASGVKEISLFLLSPKIFTEAMEFELSEVCEDIYYAPFNRSYLIKALKQRWPGLRAKEDLFEAERDFSEVIHVSNPVKMVQISEAGLVIEYYRELALGSFREFVFWMPNEVDVPTLTAQCNFNKTVEGKGTFHCHFIFFGMRDAELKFIRLWMKHHYVESKQKDG